MSTSIRLLQLAWADLIAAAPYATVGAALWVVIAYYFLQSIIDALTGRPVLPARADLVSLPAAVLLHVDASRLVGQGQRAARAVRPGRLLRLGAGKRSQFLPPAHPAADGEAS